VQGGATAYTPRGGLYRAEHPGAGWARDGGEQPGGPATPIPSGGTGADPSIDTQIAAMRTSWPRLQAERIDARTVAGVGL